MRDLFAELLLESRLVVMPSEFLSASANIGSSRYDIRSVAGLLKHVSCPDAVPSASSAIAASSNDCDYGFMPSPPPPPALPPSVDLVNPIQCVELEMQLAMQHGPVLPRHDHFVLGSFNPDEAQQCVLPGVVLHSADIANTGIVCESDSLVAPDVQPEEFVSRRCVAQPLIGCPVVNPCVDADGADVCVELKIHYLLES